MYRKAREGSRVELVSELVAPASGLVECGLVYVMEGFKEEGMSLCVFKQFLRAAREVSQRWRWGR